MVFESLVIKLTSFTNCESAKVLRKKIIQPMTLRAHEER